MSSPLGAENTASAITPDPVLVPATIPDIIEAADDPDADADSTFGTDSGGSSLNYGSVASSIYNYRLENGRTYHAYSDGKYQLPNDEQEQERLDIVYHAIQIMMEGKSFFAPVIPQRILDVGCGTGIWALDVGDEYPQAHVIGIDLSPIQPMWTAQNVEFRVDDLEKPWVFNKSFDLIHSRICSGLAIQSWPDYLAESLKYLRPGGWVEAQEFNLDVRSDDGTLTAESKIKRWHDLFHEGMMLAGRNMSVGSAEIKAYMEEASFIHVTVKEWKLPISPWAKDERLKEAGAYAMLSIMGNLGGVSVAVFTRFLGWNRIEFELFIAEVKKEWMKKGIHGYWPLFSVYGQKPEDNTQKDEIEVEFGPGASAV